MLYKKISSNKIKHYNFNYRNNFKSNIICPKTSRIIETNLCFKCNFSHITNAKHNSGRNLTSLICLFGIRNEVENE